MEKKFTKCECCPFYAKRKQGWCCSRRSESYHCIFDYNSGFGIEGCMKILRTWIKANNGFEVKEK